MIRYIFTFIVLLPLLGLAQEPSYPMEVLPGQSKTISSRNDTLWVLKHSQMQKALSFGKENRLLKEEIDILRQKIGTQNNITQEKDTLNSLHAKDAVYYKQLWQDTDKDLQTVAQKYKRQKLYNKILMGGVVASFILGVFLF